MPQDNPKANSEKENNSILPNLIRYLYKRAVYHHEKPMPTGDARDFASEARAAIEDYAAAEFKRGEEQGRREARELLQELVEDEGDCQYDHDDFCQAHYFSRPCANARAVAWLAALDAGKGE